MKSKPVLFSVLLLMLILNACSPFTITSSSGQQPTPVEESESPGTAYQPVQVDQVQVEVGVGSPIPVQVSVSGNLPHSCAQIELVQQKQEGAHFEIAMSTIPSNAEGCLLARDTLPFRMVIPLNITNLPAGSYSVGVNGTQADFELETGNTTASRPDTDTVIRKDDVQVDSLNVEIGVGSPIPVHAIVALDLPNSCAQLGEIRLHREDKTFFVRLIADIAERPDCREDSIPFRLEVPLNVVSLPAGPYVVNVNGATASFDPRALPVPSGEAEAVEEGKLISVEHVGVQVGEGSPIPVEIVASGTWPDLCAQVAEVQSKVDGFQIDVTVLASTVEACPPDHLGLPFRFALPLNIVELPDGEYTITVNGASTTFDLPLSP